MACRKFGRLLLAGLPLAGLLWLLFLRFATDRWIWSVPTGFTGAALLLGGSVLAAPVWGRWLYIGWHTVTRTIELAVTRLLLFVMFYAILTPVGFVRRRRSPGFFRGPAPGKKSYWQEIPPVEDGARYYRQF